VADFSVKQGSPKSGKKDERPSCRPTEGKGEGALGISGHKSKVAKRLPSVQPEKKRLPMAEERAALHAKKVEKGARRVNPRKVFKV